ncbi:hypothetical protein [uncultured Dysosmobacter sp.]|uniref:hypothetical protein n=1 Tax=uncultured Dysosmobacter sp. TaxID=2591384 RepID=UPI002629FA60|nr:hypothetical protein [uncultured Dysosmobacter sp.]
MSRCRMCGAEIDWIQTPEGKYVAVDPEPVVVAENTGTDVFYTDEGRKFVGTESGLPWRPDLEVGFVPHVRTCVYFRTGR